jgi:polysaccharide chain length determinant protein (PEP-CTERM system associated)
VTFFDPIDLLRAGLAIAWRRRYLLTVPVLVLAPLGLAAGFVAPKRYEARTTLLVQEPAKLNPFLNDLAISTNLKDRMPALKALLHSEHVLDKVLRDIGRIGEKTSPREREAMIATLSSAILARLVGNELVEIKVSGDSAEGLLRLLQAISVRFVERILSPEQSAVAGSQSFLEGQLISMKAAVAAAEQAFSDFRSRNADKLPTLQTANITRIAALQQRLEERAVELAAAEATFEDLRLRLAATNPVVGNIEEQIVVVGGLLAALRARYTDEHSEVQAAERRLGRLQDERQALMRQSRALAESDIDRLWNIAAGRAESGDKTMPPLLVSQMLKLQDAQTKRMGLRKEIQQLQDNLRGLQDSMEAFAPIEQEQQRLERVVVQARDMFETLNKRYEMSRITGALGRFEAPERVKVIDPPVEPTSPVGPGKALFMLAGIFAGLLLGAGLAVVAELLDRRLRSDKDFERIAGVPVIARLPKLAVVL